MQLLLFRLFSVCSVYSVVPLLFFRRYHPAMTTRRTPRLSIRDAGPMGRGVFADEPIRKGQVIEVCPVVPLPLEDEAKVATTAPDPYVHVWADAHIRTCLALR